MNLNYGDDIEKQRKLDLLNYQLNEIEKADLQEAEEEELGEKQKLMAASEKIAQNLQEAQGEIDNHAIDGLNTAIRALEKIEQYNSVYSDYVTRLKSSYYEIQEVSRDLAMEEISFDQEEQNRVEERLDFIRSLKRKYGSTIGEILAYKNQIEKEIDTISNLETYIQKLKSKANSLEKELFELANCLHEIRIQYAEKLSRKNNERVK